MKMKFKLKSTVPLKSFQHTKNCFIVAYMCIKRQKLKATVLIVNVPYFPYVPNYMYVYVCIFREIDR